MERHRPTFFVAIGLPLIIMIFAVAVTELTWSGPACGPDALPISPLDAFPYLAIGSGVGTALFGVYRRQRYLLLGFQVLASTAMTAFLLFFSFLALAGGHGCFN
jgi:hypothetical protein